MEWEFFCLRCGRPVDISPGPDMPEDGSAYRVWRCACGLVYDLGRQDGQGYVFLRPDSIDWQQDRREDADSRRYLPLREGKEGIG
jgi:DNA-directed RNA polymerase subunit RPC12/RpoP